MKITENLQIDFQDETRPLLERLCERISIWRREIGLKTCPDLEELQEASKLAENSGMERDFFAFVIGGCEWYFRVFRPNLTDLKKTIKDRLNTPNYSPYARKDGSNFFGWCPVTTPRVPGILNAYVDNCLKNFWDGDHSEGSRISLRREVDDLAKEFNQPFQVRYFHPLPFKQGGYPKLSPWVAGTVVYGIVKQRYPQHQNSRPITAGMAVSGVLLNRTTEPSEFHRRKKEIQLIYPDIGQKFQEAYLDFTQKQNLKIDKTLVEQNLHIPDYFVHMAWHFLDNQHFYEKRPNN